MDNFKCESCGKCFETEKQLRGHLAYEARRLKKMKESAMPASAQPATVPEVKAPDFTKYKELPPPIVEHLQRTWGNWLNHFEIGQEFKQDFGGYGMYVIVPPEYSIEHETVQWPVFDNKTRTQTGFKSVVIRDIRWKTLKDLVDAKSWLDQVKEKIIRDAFSAGKQLPNMGVKLETGKKTVEDYKRELAGV